MNVANEFEKIIVLLHEDSPVATLEKMTWPAGFPIKVARITASDESHESGEGLRASLDSHMDVIAHPAIRVDAVFISREPLFEKGLPPPSIIVNTKNWLSAVTAQNNVVQATGQVEPGFARHAEFSGRF